MGDFCPEGNAMETILNVFKIGLGPSSSHTLGPMKAAKIFADRLAAVHVVDDVVSLKVELFGSLGLTGKGHLSDQAIMLGLSGYVAETVDIDAIPLIIGEIYASHTLSMTDKNIPVPFDPDLDFTFSATALALHENSMIFTVTLANGEVIKETYYSPGGGDVVSEEDFGKEIVDDHLYPHPFTSAEQLIGICEDNSFSIADLAADNEASLRPRGETRDYCRRIWLIMQDCLARGLRSAGPLPGPLHIGRRAAALKTKLVSQRNISTDPFMVMDWVNAWALAVSEENAAGGRVVTAPTNGSCGVVPAVLMYYHAYIANLDDDLLERFFLTAGAIGMLFRMNASISGAEVGCQGEIGVACSMAAAGLTELMGGSPFQVGMAAEIGMEHNLGLTCDPVNGQVQIPCIERNAINAVKAINASRMALERASRGAVTLDAVIGVMLETGKDMNVKYRETATGGLATTPAFLCR